ncbi:MAG: hypothetical protein ACOX8Q_07330 [Christensenellales bacterium]|jgi:hypothetical protein
MKQIIQSVIDNLNASHLKGKTITLGFDGCADTICRVVKKYNEDQLELFETISHFSEYLAQKSGISCSIELEEQTTKAGGNGPIFATAVSEYGINTSVVGLFGKSQCNEIFDELKSRCKMYSYSKNAMAIVLEFNDGKIMLSPRVRINGDVWEQIVAAVGEDNMQSVFADVDMLGLVNWSELEYCTTIWKRLFEYLSKTPDKSKQIIVDLADCSRKNVRSITEMLDLLEQFTYIRKVILSLNESEAMELYRVLCNKSHSGEDYEKLGFTLADIIKVDRLVLHSRKCCYSYEAGRISSMPTQFNETPKLQTGGGDNFNAGYALGCILDFPPEYCNVLGNAVSSYYISYGKSPGLKELKRHLEQWYLSLE